MILAGPAAAPAAAQRGRGNRSQGAPPGHDRARRAVRSGHALPLEEILAAVERRYPGKVLDVELASGERGYVYRLKVLNRRGEVLAIAVDGASGRVLSVRGGGR